MRLLIGIFAAALAAILHAQAAHAQIPAEALSCPQCRAMAHFKTCQQPIDGAKTFVGIVVDARTDRCSQIMSVQARGASELGLPALAQIDLGYCAIWAGQSGDIIDLAVSAPQPGDNVYRLACRLW